MTRWDPMTEDQLLIEVERLLTLFKWRWHHVRRSDRAIQQGDQGWPDIFATRGTVAIAAELKSDTGRYRPGQQEWLDALKAAGVRTYTWRPSDLEQIVEVLG